MWRLFGAHLDNAGLQAANFIHHRIATPTDTLNLGIDLRRLDEIVRHIDPA